MLYGGAAVAILWFGNGLSALVAVRVAVVPLFWPALLAASLLAWTQALTWMPYRLRGVRVVIAVLWLAAIDTIVMVALNSKRANW